MRHRSWPMLIALALPFFNLLGCTSTGARIGGICIRAMPAEVTPAHVSAALDRALTPEFIQYVTSLRKDRGGSWSEADVRAGILVELLPYSEVAKRGLTIQPEPRADQTYVYYTFEGSDAAAFCVRDLVDDYLEDLIALDLLSTADSDEARIAALKLLSPTVPYGAEWIERDLLRLIETGPAAPVEEAARKKLEYVRQYIADPTMRALPAGLRVELERRNETTRPATSRKEASNADYQRFMGSAWPRVVLDNSVSQPPYLGNAFVGALGASMTYDGTDGMTTLTPRNGTPVRVKDSFRIHVRSVSEGWELSCDAAWRSSYTGFLVLGSTEANGAGIPRLQAPQTRELTIGVNRCTLEAIGDVEVTIAGASARGLAEVLVGKE